MKRDRKNDCKSSHYFHIPKYKKTVKMLSQKETTSSKKSIKVLKNAFKERKIQFLFKIKILIKILNQRKYIFVGLSSV